MLQLQWSKECAGMPQRWWTHSVLHDAGIHGPIALRTTVVTKSRNYYQQTTRAISIAYHLRVSCTTSLTPRGTETYWEALPEPLCQQEAMLQTSLHICLSYSGGLGLQEFGGTGFRMKLFPFLGVFVQVISEAVWCD